MLKIQGHSNSHPTCITQAAALKAYTTDMSGEINKMVAEFKKRRDWIVAALNDIPGVSCIKPDGAFYVFPDFSGVLGKPLKYGRTCNSSEELSTYLLDTVKGRHCAWRGVWRARLRPAELCAEPGQDSGGRGAD